MKFTLCAIHVPSGTFGEEPFDLTTLPFAIVENVRIENVSDRFREDAFNLWREDIGTRAWDALRGIRHALVHRYDPRPTFDETKRRYTSEEEISQQSETLVRWLDACLRLIRPMRQSVFLIHGDIREDGTFDVRGFEAPSDPFIEVPEAHKLFALRNSDAVDLKTYASEFLRAMRGQFWKFRMAVQFHERGFFQPLDWKARYILWCAAIEAIYTTHNFEHKGRQVLIARLKWFLGAETKMYEPPRRWDTAVGSDLTIGEVLDDVFELRNYIAHGDRIPDDFFNETPRHSIAGPVLKPEVLTEAVSFIIRTSLLKILRDGLLGHFIDAEPAEAHFAAQKLTARDIRAAQARGQSSS